MLESNIDEEDIVRYRTRGATRTEKFVDPGHRRLVPADVTRFAAPLPFYSVVPNSRPKVHMYSHN